MSSDYDPADLRNLQYIRAAIDPIPVHPRGQHVLDVEIDTSAEHVPVGQLGPDAVVAARLNQVAAQDEPAPIERAPWPEAMVCVRSTFGDARFATSPLWVGVVKYTFRQYLAAQELDPDAMVPEGFFQGPVLPGDVDPDSATPTDASVYDLASAADGQWMGITDTHRETAETFRRRLKHARDCVFVADLYDRLCEVPDLEVAVPKLVWRDAVVDAAADRTEADCDSADADDTTAQTALDMF